MIYSKPKQLRDVCHEPTATSTEAAIAPPLLTIREVEASSVVANNRMNRERMLLGVNSYQNELGRVGSPGTTDLVGFLTALATRLDGIEWIDCCCGEGNALIQAGTALVNSPPATSFRFEGIDLVGMFSEVPASIQDRVCLRAGSVTEWNPVHCYDLITCIHGVHYLGDKLGFIRKAIGCLKPSGRLIMSMDPDNLRDEKGASLSAWWRAECRRNGWKYQPRRHLLRVDGFKTWSAAWQFLGSDDQAGPNYTGQAAVDSYYQIVRDSVMKSNKSCQEDDPWKNPRRQYQNELS
jgi:SAM-dependent methyltransferase